MFALRSRQVAFSTMSGSR